MSSSALSNELTDVTNTVQLFIQGVNTEFEVTGRIFLSDLCEITIGKNTFKIEKTYFSIT